MYAPNNKANGSADLSLWDQVVIPRKILDTCAEKGWLLSTAEIAQIINLNSAAITARGRKFEHETWVFSQVKRQGNYYVWSVARV